MTKVKILALLVGMMLLFILPATVTAQRLPPHVFVGTASIDDAAAPDGTTVTAWVAGAEAASTTTSGTDGDYVIQVDQGEGSFTGETITFLIGGYSAEQSAAWMQGGGDELTLSATSDAVAEETPEPTAVPAVVEAVPGERGPRGRTGSTGAAGPEGPDGSAGPRGDSGTTGSGGPAGDDGAKGDTGPAGSQGTAGSAGSQGPSGAVGREGDDASGALGFIALILAIIGIAGAGGAFLLSRRS